MLKTEIKFRNGKPFVSVNSTLHAPVAYTTYFEERGNFAEFINCGFRMFFINISFTDLPINNNTGFTPFRTGVFENDTPDYSEFEHHVHRILEICPDALIFPRINVAMPRKWIESHPEETVTTPKGGNREALCSSAFLEDGAKLLEEMISHFRDSDYAHAIAGYQICGGITQEWMHHDCFGSYCDMTLRKFRKWMKEKYGIDNAPLPERADFDTRIFSETTSRFGEFCNETASKTVEHFAKKTTEFINNEQIVGVFYGYSAFVTDYMQGLHGLHNIIDSPYIDFFSSPCAYDANRALGADWGDMIPVDSVKLHGKMNFIECDIRTHLTRSMHEARPGECPEEFYHLTDKNGNKTVWCGPENADLSLSAIRKAFAHQLTKGSGMWWFDMWGGWYNDEKILDDFGKIKLIAEESENKNNDLFPKAETVLFIDEKAYCNLARFTPPVSAVTNIRVAMGNTGIPFDMYLTQDAEKVLHHYKAAIFTAPVPSESGKKAFELCKKMNIPYISATTGKYIFPTDELRETLIDFGIHCYNNQNAVTYVGGGFLAVHSTEDGENTINLPKKYRVKPLLSDGFSECETDTITLTMKKHHTYIFELT